MEVNAILIKEQRTTRAWTQQHLADACGLSLRTVQRIERYGTCSVDTLMSLSAVLEMDKQDLLTAIPPVTEESKQGNLKLKLSIALAVALGMFLGAALMYFFIA